nr:hypothetical protein [Tanacetum cinerariifolium]
MTNYSLWEVILNGDSPAPTRVIEGVVQHVAPTTAEQSTNEPVSAAASVSTVSAKILVYALPNVDTLSNVVIYSFFASQSTSPQLDNNDLKQIDADDLEEMDLKWQMAMLTHIDADDLEEMDLKRQMAMLTVRARQRNLGANGPTSMGFDMSKVECYNCHRKGHFAMECRSPKDTRRNGAAEPQRRNVPIENSKSNALVSQCDGVGRPSAPIIEDWVYDSEDDCKTKISQDVPSFVQSNEQVKSPRPSVKTIESSIPTANTRTSIPKPNNNENHRNRKACFVCKSLDHLIKDCDFYEKKMAQTHVRNHAQIRNHQQYANITLPNPLKHVVPTAILTQSKLVPITAARPVTAVVPKPHVTRPRQAKSVVTKPYSPPRRHINHSPSPKASNFPLKVIVVKVPQVNAAKSV